MGFVPDTVTIDTRFCGPPTSGNGGYTCGLVARAFGAAESDAIEVTLRRPPPLDRPLTIDTRDERVVLLDGEEVIADAVATALDVAAPEPIGMERAQRAAEHSPMVDHPDWH